MRGLNSAVACAVLAVSAGVANGQYVINRVADTSATYAGFGAPAINDFGAVAYQASLAAGGQGIFRTRGGQTTPISTGPLFEDTVSMNNAGTVAYIATGGADWGVYASSGNGGPTATIMTASNFAPISVLNGTDINDSGTVAFRARLAVIGGYGIWQGDGTANPAPVFQQAGAVTYVTAPAISNSGEIAYAWRNLSGDTIVKTTSGDVLTPATPYADGFISQAVTGVDRIDINNAGDLAFDGDWAFGGSLFVRNNGVLTRPVNADVVAAINDSDLLAALVINGAASSLRVGAGSLSTTIISTGDALDGSTVTGLAFNPEGLNDAGWVAFRATLADGRQGVYVASVPEPASAGAAALAGVVLAARRRRR